MFEDLRKSASESYEEYKEKPEEKPDFYEDPYDYRQPAASQRGFLGMTAAQRLVLVLLLFFMACVLSGLCLIITGKISPPIF